MSAEIKVGIGADTSKLTQGLNQAKAQINAFSSGQLKSIGNTIAGAFTVGAITGLAMEAVNLGSKFDDLSKRTGLSAEELQRLNYAAVQNGSSIEAMVGGLQKLAIARQKALADPGSEQGKAFADLGISIQEVASLSPEQLFYRIADAVKNMGAAQNNAASMTTLLGKSFGELVPMMAEGGDGLRKMADEATRLGLVLSTSAIKNLDELGDRMASMKMISASWSAAVIKHVSDIGASIGAIMSNPKGFWDSLWGNNSAEAAKLTQDFIGATTAPAKPKPPPLATDIGESASDKSKRERDEARAAKRASDDAAAKGIALMKMDEESRKMDVEQAKQDMKDAFDLADIKTGKGISVSAPITDNLARIGGFVGGKGDAGLKVQERQLKIQEKIEENTRKNQERDAIRDMTSGG